MQDIIKPIDRAILKAELTKEKKLRSTNKSNNEIYIVKEKPADPKAAKKPAAKKPAAKKDEKEEEK